MPLPEHVLIVAGHIGKKPDVRETKNGTAVCNLSIPHNYAKDKTHWYSATLWGSDAEKAAEYNKGDFIEARLYITGQREYENKQGQTVIATDYKAKVLNHIVKRDDSSQGFNKQQRSHVTEQDIENAF